MSRISLNQVESSERFYRIPKVFTDENSYYSTMRLESKFAYGLLKDRFELSIKNHWVDKENNVYLIFTIKELGKVLGCKKDKVHSIKKELAEYGLLEEERQGLNKPNRIYVLNVDVTRTSEKPTSKETSDSKDIGNSDIQISENQMSRSLNNRHQDIYNSDTNDTECSDTDLNDTENNLFYDEEDEKINQEIPESDFELSKTVQDFCDEQLHVDESLQTLDKENLNLIKTELENSYWEIGEEQTKVHFKQALDYTLENIVDPRRFGAYLTKNMQLQALKLNTANRIKEIEVQHQPEFVIPMVGDWTRTEM